MRNNGHGLILTICLLGVLALVCSSLDWWFWFGTVNWLLIALTLSVGYGRERRRKPILHTVIAVFLGYFALFSALVWMHDPQSDLRLWLGFPTGTAFFIYGIWPFGIVASILHAVVFDRFVLPKDKLRKLLAEFGRREETP